ncbi:MAG: thiamine ABC transporter substrate-binding protein [Methanobacteriota archaeon]|nr:MAG: thiamine ABC transporter substrate-binding protein [Euryarchaeota archaeon]
MEPRKFLVLFAIFLIGQGIGVPIHTVAQSEKLTIYTYDSLLADPGFDIEGNFSAFAGIPRENIEIVRFEDAGSILTRAVAEKDSPVADVLIGLDNVLIHQARTEDILEPYKPNGAEGLRDGLVDDLAPDYLMTPYDYGVFAIWYDETRFEGFQGDFSLEALRNPEVAKQLVVENPQVSSVGLGFLLWSIAEYGDKVLGDDGSAWKDFWADLAKNDARLTPSWGDALDLFFDSSANRSMMVSYTTSPAYGECNFGGDTTNAIITETQDGYEGWFQIEGIGLVKNSDNKDLAKKFIDWFISEDVQKEIYVHQYMYPALDSVKTPECYVNSTIDKDQITPLNSKIPASVINETLDQWLADWEQTWAGTDVAFVDGFPFYLAISGIMIISLVVKRRKPLKH